MRMVEIGVTVCVLALGMPANPAFSQQAKPPIWVIEDEDSTLYMVGTVHVMREGTGWRSPGFDKAIAEADAVWLEIPDLTPPDNMFGLLSQYAFSPDAPLSERLDADQLAAFENILADHGVPLGSLDGSEPWFAYLQLNGLLMAEMGFDPMIGIDAMIKEQAQERGIPVLGFETFESQFTMLASMPTDLQLEVLVQTVEEYDLAREELAVQLESWISGDLDLLEEMTIEISQELPGFYEVLFAERNRGFVDGIEDIMDGEGTTLVAVGLGHFVGPDSIPEILRERGYTVEQR